MAADATSVPADPAPPRIARRELARLTAASAGFLAADAVLPTSWLTPVVHAAALPPEGVGSKPGGGVEITFRKLPPGVIRGTNSLPRGTGAAGTGAAGEGGAGESGTGGGGEGGMGGGGTGGSAGTPETGEKGSTTFPDGDTKGLGNPCKNPPTSAPASPSPLTVTELSPTSVEIRWTPPPGVTEFYMEVSGGGGVRAFPVVGDRLVVQDLDPCTPYWFYVYGVDCGVRSAGRGAAFFQTGPDLSITPSPALTQLSCSGATIEFPQLECITYYQVEVSDDGENWSPATSSWLTTVTFNGLCPNTTYYVRVRGRRNEQVTPWSTTLTFTTLESNGDPNCECSEHHEETGGGYGGHYGGGDEYP